VSGRNGEQFILATRRLLDEHMMDALAPQLTREKQTDGSGSDDQDLGLPSHTAPRELVGSTVRRQTYDVGTASLLDLKLQW
jgi:hypothetical protein